MKKGKRMGIFGILILTVAVLLVASSVSVRLAPSDPEVWHVDPMTTSRPEGKGHYLLRPKGGDAASPEYDLTPEALLAKVDAIAMATPRTQRLAGSVAEGRITFITRSRGFGFPDYTSVKTYRGKTGAGIAIFARQRFGREDLGVNKARVDDWLAQLQG